jgi:hypothetical protein
VHQISRDGSIVRRMQILPDHISAPHRHLRAGGRPAMIFSRIHRFPLPVIMPLLLSRPALHSRFPRCDGYPIK